MDKTNYAEITLGSNYRNNANFVSKWFFWYLNPIFTKGSKEKVKKVKFLLEIQIKIANFRI